CGYTTPSRSFFAVAQRWTLEHSGLRLTSPINSRNAGPVTIDIRPLSRPPSHRLDLVVHGATFLDSPIRITGDPRRASSYFKRLKDRFWDIPDNHHDDSPKGFHVDDISFSRYRLLDGSCNFFGFCRQFGGQVDSLDHLGRYEPGLHRDHMHALLGETVSQ